MNRSTLACRVAAAVPPVIKAAVVVVILLAPAQSLFAQGKGRATLSVGITIVAADDPAAADSDDKRIPVDPDYAIDDEHPLRDARVERVSAADGRQLQVVIY